MISNSARFAKISFVPEKYANPADCDGCGGNTVASTLATVSDEFIHKGVYHIIRRKYGHFIL